VRLVAVSYGKRLNYPVMSMRLPCGSTDSLDFSTKDLLTLQATAY